MTEMTPTMQAVRSAMRLNSYCGHNWEYTGDGWVNGEDSKEFHEMPLTDQQIIKLARELCEK